MMTRKKRRLLQNSGGVEHNGIPVGSEVKDHKEAGDDADPAELNDKSEKEAKDDSLGTSLFNETVKNTS